LKRALKWLVGIAAAIVLLAIVAAIALPYLVDTPRVHALIATNASQAVGRPVTYASLSIAIFPLPAVELHKLEIAEDPQFGTTPFLTLETGRIRLKLRPLLSGRVEFGDITLVKPLISVIQSADGRLNVASLGATGETKTAPRSGKPSGGGAGGAMAGVAAQINITQGAVTYVARGKEGRGTPYRVQDLDLTLAGQSMQLNFKGGLKVVPGDLAVKLADGVVALNGAKNVSDAPIRGRVTIDGKDVSRLVAAAAGPTPAISGPIAGTFVLGGTVAAPKVTGDVEMASPSVTQTNAACPEPKQRTLSLGAFKVAGASYSNDRFQSRPVTTSIGKGTISLNLTATLDQGVRVQVGDLALKGIPVERVMVDFLCQGYAVSGPLDLTGAATFGAADIFNTLDGAGDLRIGPGKVVGPQALALIGTVVRVGGAVSSLLASDLSPNLFASPVDFDSITGTWKVTNGVLSSKDLLYSSRVMKIGVVGEYGLATGRVNADMRVNHGKGEIRAKVTGNAASPSVRVDPASIIGEGGRQKVEEGIQDLLKRFKR
jgi:AsmA family/AsmA-like C-terminal region